MSSHDVDTHDLQIHTQRNKLDGTIAEVDPGRFKETNTRRGPGASLLLGQRRRRWPNIKPAPGPRVSASQVSSHWCCHS